MKKEVRCWNLKDMNLRIVRKEDGALPKIEGYAAVFNTDSEDMGFVERIAPGAFKKALKRSDARALFNHDPNYVLGRQSSGTLSLKEDKNGLWMSVRPPDTQLIRDMVLSPIERGDINQQSFGFTIEEDEWKGLDSDVPTRTIKQVQEVFDVSPVTYPAYQDTSVGLRSLENARKTAEDETPDQKITITIDGEATEFTGDDRIDRAADKINSLRPGPKPTLPDPGNADAEPTLIPPSDSTIDLLGKIETITKRYEVER